MEKIILNKKLIFLLLLFTSFLFSGNEFVKSKIRQGELRLFFSSDIERVTYFSIPIEDGITKYVYDIHGASLPSGKGISHHSYRDIESFRIAQNSSKRLRVVIKSKQKALDKHVYRGKMLVIPLIYGKDATIMREALNNKYTIVIDAGHGGKDNGATCCAERIEKKIALSIAQKLKDKLTSIGYKIYMTRNEDSFVRLPKRTEFANNKNADIFISVHANAAPNKEQASIFKGVEIYYLSPAQTQRAKDAAEKENGVMFEGTDYYTKNAYLSLVSREKIVESHKLGLDVSRFILKNVRKEYGDVEDGGVKGANFWVLVGAQRPAILVETGYLTHPKEGKNLLDEKYQDLLATGITQGITQYLKNQR